MNNGLYRGTPSLFFFRIIETEICITRNILRCGNSVVYSDEELRKKYDLYGEEGLKDDHFGGGHYQSWSYFNEEFGELRILFNLLISDFLFS